MRPGVWNGINVTKEYIKKIFNSTRNREYQNDEFPHVKGHPRDNSPAEGWANKNNLIIDDDNHLKIKMEKDDLNKNFLEEIKEKKFKNISISLRPDYSIRHIGWFGGAPTAVSGLKPAFGEGTNFSEDLTFNCTEFNSTEQDEDMIIEFSEFEISRHQMNTAKRLFRRIKNFFISKYDLETADVLIPEGELELVNDPFYVYRKENNNFSEIDRTSKMDLTPEEVQELQRKADENSTLKAQLAQKEADERYRKAINFCEKELSNNVTPAMRPKIAHTIAFLEENSKPIEFSEDGSTVSVDPLSVFKEVLQKLPPMEFSEYAKNGKDEESEEDKLYTEATEIASALN